MADQAIVVDGLVKRFAGVLALDRVDFVVEQARCSGSSAPTVLARRPQSGY